MKKLLIIGAGGFSKSVIDIIEDEYLIEGFIDSYKTGEHFGYPIVASNLENFRERNDYIYFIAIGDNNDRKTWYDKLIRYNLEVINVVDKSSIISKKVKLGKGVFIGKMTIINAGTTIENNVIINTRALIEHGNYISEHCNISTNAVLNGDVKVGRKSFIGSMTVVNGQITIGKNTVVGSGSVVIRDIEDNMVVAGCPTRIVRRNEDNE